MTVFRRPEGVPARSGRVGRLIRHLGVATVLAGGLAGHAAAVNLTGNPQDDWPTYGGSFSNQRFSQLAQVTPENVENLRVKWTFRIPGAGVPGASLETTPIVVRGSSAGLPALDAVMFVTSPFSGVFALDGATGRQLWSFSTPLRSPLKLCCSPSNRGVAFGLVEVAPSVLEPRVYVAALDARLWALDAATGQPRAGFADGVGPAGSVTVADNNAGFGLTMAPLFIPKANIPPGGVASGRDVVVVGISGGEFETRGFVTAYDAVTGNLLWRFFTIPAPGDFGGNTWPTIPPPSPFADPFLRGGGAVWMTPAYDPATGSLFVAVGNPAPPLDGTHRAGDNLFANSIVALDVRTGQRIWHFQEVHHDLWDYDAASPPLLFDANGTPAVGQAGKTGFFYIVDRGTGVPIFPCAETPVPPSQVVAPDGTPELASPTQPLCGAGQQFVPFRRPGERSPPFQSQPIFTPPSARGVRVTPGSRGASEWSPVALHPGLGLAFVSGIVEPTWFRAVPEAQPTPGQFSFGGIVLPQLRRREGAFTAIDVNTGTVRWQRSTSMPLVGGALATASGLVFYGEGASTGGAFVALDAATGAEQFRFATRGGVNAAPVSFLADGTQLVTVAAGGNVLSSSRADDLLITFELRSGED